MNQPYKPALIVIGMHRSGTSATTGALQCLGVQLGKRLYRGHVDINAKGYFEHSDITDRNDEILMQLGSSWDDPLLKSDNWHNDKKLNQLKTQLSSYIQRDFATSKLWAVKDPRICRLLPLWLDIFKENAISPRFLFVIRHPDEVFRSLEKRDGFSREKSFLLWTLHYLEAEICSRGYPRSFISFNKFIENPSAQLMQIEKELQIEFPIPINKAMEKLDQFISKDLRHHKGKASTPSYGSEIINLTTKLASRLNQVAMNEKSTDELNCDDLQIIMQKIQDSFTPIIGEQLALVGQQRGEQTLTLNRLIRSWSWETGKPVRFIERLFGRNV